MPWMIFFARLGQDHCIWKQIEMPNSYTLPHRSTGVGAPNVLHHALRSRVAVAGFEPAEARRIPRKLEFHYPQSTPLGSTRWRSSFRCYISNAWEDGA
jgi:hypothetical protein